MSSDKVASGKKIEDLNKEHAEKYKEKNYDKVALRSYKKLHDKKIDRLVEEIRGKS